MPLEHELYAGHQKKAAIRQVVKTGQVFACYEEHTEFWDSKYGPSIPYECSEDTPNAA